MRLPLINIRSIEQFEMALFIIYFLLMVKQFSGVTLIFPQKMVTFFFLSVLIFLLCNIVKYLEKKVERKRELYTLNITHTITFISNQ